MRCSNFLSKWFIAIGSTFWFLKKFSFILPDFQFFGRIFVWKSKVSETFEDNSDRIQFKHIKSWPTSNIKFVLVNLWSHKLPEIKISAVQDIENQSGLHYMNQYNVFSIEGYLQKWNSMNHRNVFKLFACKAKSTIIKPNR
jgi:hypothetical protein